MTSLNSAEVFTTWQRCITTETLVWNEITILVSYEPDWLGRWSAGLDSPYSYLELQVLHPVGAPIPLSETGYWSDFLSPGEAESCGGPLKVAAELLNEMSDHLSWRVAWARWEQRELSG